MRKMPEEIKELGIVKSTHLGWEDHGIFSFMIDFDFGGTGQGFGNYSLDTFDKIQDKRVGTAFGLAIIMKILEVAKVNKWEDLVGRELYVIRDEPMGFIRGLEAPKYRGGKRFRVDELIEEYQSSTGSAKQ